MLFSTFKKELIISPYLSVIQHVKARTDYIRLRLGVSKLLTHKLRFVRNLQEFDYFCPICHSAEENELHFLLCCPAYDDLREEYIAKKYFNNPSLFKVTMLFASTSKSVILKLCSYVHKAFNRRDVLLES